MVQREVEGSERGSRALDNRPLVIEDTTRPALIEDDGLVALNIERLPGRQIHNRSLPVAPRAGEDDAAVGVERPRALHHAAGDTQQASYGGAAAAILYSASPRERAIDRERAGAIERPARLHEASCANRAAAG